MSIRTKIRIKEWGNSLGIVIPKDIVLKEDLKSQDEVMVTINKRQVLEDFFGKLKGKKIDSQKEKEVSRKLWKMK